MITTVDIYNDVSRELNKFNSPTYTLGTFNYFNNKAILEFITDSYKSYAVSQQLTDDLRMNSKSESIGLTAEVRYISTPSKLLIDTSDTPDQGQLLSFIPEDPDKIRNYIGIGSKIQIKEDANNVIATVTGIDIDSFSVSPTTGYNFSHSPNEILIVDDNYKHDVVYNKQIISFTPSAFDYMHMLMVKLNMKYNLSPIGCNTDDRIVYKEIGVKRATFDMQSATSWNAYLSPSIKSPYYYVYNNSVNDKVNIPDDGNRYSANLPVMKLFLGSAVNNIKPISVDIVWLTVPKIYELTPQQLYSGNSPEVIKLPDYVKPSIVKMITTWIMGNEGNPLIGTFVQTNANQENIQTNKK